MKLPEKPERPEDDVEMGFFEHMAELRTRLLRAFMGIAPAMAACWVFREQLLAILLKPLQDAYAELGLEQTVHMAAPTDLFMAYIKLSLIAGILVASPWVGYQLWAFIAPGLYRREKMMAIPFVVFSSLCFTAGAVFGYFMVFPPAYATLLEFGGELPTGMQLEPTLMIDNVVSFTTRLLLAFGVAFETPVIVTGLSMMGIVNWKQLLNFGRWFIVLAAIVAAILTPPDVVTQVMMLVPLAVLYYGSVVLAFLFGPKVEPETEEA